MSGDTNQEKKDFFESCVYFPSISDHNSGSIQTVDFLEASKSVVQFVELLGKAFLPVRHDMNGNIDKLTKLYETNGQKFASLDQIVIHEKQTLSDSDFHLGTDALIWLTRALHYNLIFLELFVGDFEEGKLSEDLSDYFAKAYDQTLKKYHNWFVQQIVLLCLLSAPNRSSLLLYLTSSEKPVDETATFAAIKRYTTCLKQNVDTVHKIFGDNNINYL